MEETVAFIHDCLQRSGYAEPVEGHDVDDAVRLLQLLGEGIKVIVKAAGLSAGEAGQAGVAWSHLHVGGVKTNDVLAAFLQFLDHLIREYGAGTPGQYDDCLLSAVCHYIPSCLIR